jgi:hypothetical protein
MSTDGIIAVSVSGWSMDPTFSARVRFASVPTAATTGSGSWQLTVGPASTDVVIIITVFAANQTTALESLEQRFTIKRDPSGARRRLEPSACSSHGFGWTPGTSAPATDPVWNGRLHPRLSWSGGTTHEFPDLTVDLSFVRVTEYLKKALGGALESEYSDHVDPNDPHHGCVLHALEYTGSLGPKTWFVLVPPALNTAVVIDLISNNWTRREASNRAPRAVNALVYLRSRVTKRDKKTPNRDVLDTYSEIEKTPIVGWMNRFFAEPPAATPFFARPNAAWDSFPAIGFERQFVGSRNAPLLVQPWPSGISYDVLYRGNVRLLLDRLAICMSASGAIARSSVFDIRCGRIGVAGFSGGGNEAIKVWRADRRNIDELYLFDPQSFRQDQGKGVSLLIDAKGAVAPDLREWYRDTGKRLRMIGGLQHGDALLIANTLQADWRNLLSSAEAGRGAPPRVWVKPTTFEFRAGLGDGEIYSRAFLVPLPAGTKDDLSERRLSATGSPASALTKATGLELVENKNPLQTTVRIVALKHNETLDCSHAELAGFLHTVWGPQIQGRGPARLWKTREANPNMLVSDTATLASLRKLLAWYMMYGQIQKAFEDDEKQGFLIHRAYSVRHQWTTPGGENDATRGASFRGHFELCLRDSAFR